MHVNLGFELLQIICQYYKNKACPIVSVVTRNRKGSSGVYLLAFINSQYYRCKPCIDQQNKKTAYYNNTMWHITMNKESSNVNLMIIKLNKIAFSYLGY